MSSARLASFRRVLAAALGTSYYRPWLEAASLHTPQQIAALGSIEQGLEKLPSLEPEVFLAHPEEFRNPAAPARRPARFVWPHGRVPRTAVLMEGMGGSRRVRVFANGLGRKLAWFRPEVLAGPFCKLERLAALLESGALAMRPPSHAVILLTRMDQPPLGEAERERLWAAYQVPVYQQILGFAGELLAWECEAHQGLHVVCDAVVLEEQTGRGEERLLATSLADLVHPVLRLAVGWRARLTEQLCGCGRAGQRLLLEADGAARARSRAAPGSAQAVSAAVIC
jgi:hypothetical protein